MVVRRRKKNSRAKAKTTHGYGSMKKNRGAGNRGGRGNAGSGKRADAKKPNSQKIKRYFGKYGFKSKNQKEIVAITTYTIQQKLNTWLAAKKISKENDTFIIDLGALGYDKLLSKGAVKAKLKITAQAATQNAIQKIKEAGGEIIGVSFEKASDGSSE